MVEAELGDAAVRAEALLEPLELHHVGRGLQRGAQRAAEVAGVHVQLVGVLEGREAGVAAQVVDDAVVLHRVLRHFILKKCKIDSLFIYLFIEGLYSPANRTQSPRSGLFTSSNLTQVECKTINLFIY